MAQHKFVVTSKIGDENAIQMRLIVKRDLKLCASSRMHKTGISLNHLISLIGNLPGDAKYMRIQEYPIIRSDDADAEKPNP